LEKLKGLAFAGLFLFGGSQEVVRPWPAWQPAWPGSPSPWGAPPL